MAAQAAIHASVRGRCGGSEVEPDAPPKSALPREIVEAGVDGRLRGHDVLGLIPGTRISQRER
jgi:hypothetical protein